MSNWILDDFSTISSDKEVKLTHNKNESHIDSLSEYDKYIEFDDLTFDASVLTGQSESIYDDPYIYNDVWKTSCPTDVCNESQSDFWKTSAIPPSITPAIPSAIPEPVFSFDMSPWKPPSVLKSLSKDKELIIKKNITEPFEIENEGETYIESNSKSFQKAVSPPKNEYYKSEYYCNNFEMTTKYNYKMDKYYFDIISIFNHITLGRSFPDEYYELINNHVCNIVNGCNIESLSNNNKFNKEVYSFNGRKYNKIIVMYEIGHFNIIAHTLLDWAVKNPEKIA